ncbi:hypothetical protein Tco_0582703 [Tanacetum coccineum]
MVVWCSVVMECEGGDDDDGGTVVMGTGSDGDVGDGLKMMTMVVVTRRWWRGGNECEVDVDGGLAAVAGVWPDNNNYNQNGDGEVVKCNILRNNIPKIRSTFGELTKSSGDRDGISYSGRTLMSMGRVFKTRLRRRGVKQSGEIDIEFRIADEYTVKDDELGLPMDERDTLIRDLDFELDEFGEGGEGDGGVGVKVVTMVTRWWRSDGVDEEEMKECGIEEVTRGGVDDGDSGCGEDVVVSSG